MLAAALWVLVAASQEVSPGHGNLQLQLARHVMRLKQLAQILRRLRIGRLEVEGAMAWVGLCDVRNKYPYVSQVAHQTCLRLSRTVYEHHWLLAYEGLVDLELRVVGVEVGCKGGTGASGGTTQHKGKREREMSRSQQVSEL